MTVVIKYGYIYFNLTIAQGHGKRKPMAGNGGTAKNKKTEA